MMTSVCGTCLGACSDDPQDEPVTTPTSTTATADTTPVTDVQFTTAVPSAYFQQASERGTVEVLTYASRDYAGDGSVTSKPAYVYLPYGYDPQQKYDIIYLIHGWTGTAEQYFGLDSWPQMRNLLDNMIEHGLTRPFIAVSPTWDKDNTAKDWSESTREAAAFYQEYENDLIPAVEGHYSTYATTTDHDGIVASRDHRVVGGFSLGSITTWYLFEHVFDLQRMFLPMSGDNWHIAMYGGQTYPDRTAEFLRTVVQASQYKDDFYVWYAVGDRDSRFAQTDNQARAMMKLTDTFNQSTFSYHQKVGGQHDFNAVWEFVYNALPFFFPHEGNAGVQTVKNSSSSGIAYTLNGTRATSQSRGVIILDGKKILR